jgi:hypothetical protein
MSTPFTDPTSAGFDPTLLANLNELVDALNERKAAAGIAPVSQFVAGDDLQSPAASPYRSIRGLQEALESTVQFFLDHTVTIAGAAWADLYDDGFKFALTIARWRELAGLPADGYRRVTAISPDGTKTWDNGFYQAGDYFSDPDGHPGYWLFEDLAKGISALKRTASMLSLPVEASGGAAGWSDVSMETAIAAAESTWPTGYHPPLNNSEIAYGYFYSGGTPETFIAGSHRCRAHCSILSPSEPCDVGLYLIPSATDAFLDIDGLGIEPGVVYEWQVLLAATQPSPGATWFDDWFEPGTSDPLTLVSPSKGAFGYGLGGTGEFADALRINEWKFFRSNL